MSRRCKNCQMEWKMNDKMKFNARTYSRLGQSGAVFGMCLPGLMEDYPLKVLSSDMSVTAGLDRFKVLYPDAFYNVGIAEQNLLGIASGLASEGYRTIAVAQAAFITMRSFEQVRQYAGYMQFPVIIVGISSGFALTFFGPTHYAIEDLCLMRSIPGMTVLSPADAGEAVKAFGQALKLNTPVYIRLTGGLNNPVVYPEDFDYRIGKVNWIAREGEDIILFATGSMVRQAVVAARMLKEMNIGVRVADVHTIKPLDKDAIDACKNSRLFVTVEEHSVTGGLGGALAEYMVQKNDFPPLLCLGVRNCFFNPGDYNYLIEQNRLTPELIVEDIIMKYKNL